jgi:hypothetical protein
MPADRSFHRRNACAIDKNCGFMLVPRSHGLIPETLPVSLRLHEGSIELKLQIGRQISSILIEITFPRRGVPGGEKTHLVNFYPSRRTVREHFVAAGRPCRTPGSMRRQIQVKPNRNLWALLSLFRGV